MSAREVIIIGSGPAGLTAAIYTARANLAPLVIEGLQAGGQLMLTTDVENYPGFPDGILGPDLMSKFREQAERFGAEFVTADVEEVDFAVSPKRVRVNGHDEFARTIIISTGAQARMLGLPNEQKLLGHGVSTCATCDGFFFRGHNIAVIGGGDSAVEEANFLTRFADKVTLVHRRKELRASRSCRTVRSRTRRSSSVGTASSPTSAAMDGSRRCNCRTSRREPTPTSR